MTYLIVYAGGKLTLVFSIVAFVSQGKPLLLRDLWPILAFMHIIRGTVLARFISVNRTLNETIVSLERLEVRTVRDAALVILELSES